MESGDEIKKLQAELASVRNEVRALRAHLDEARGAIDLSMRGQGRCPACAGRKLMFVEQIMVSPPGGIRFAVTLKLFGRFEGLFQAYVCAACGLVEWYVKEPGRVALDGKRVREVEPRATEPPYR